VRAPLLKRSKGLRTSLGPRAEGRSPGVGGAVRKSYKSMHANARYRMRNFFSSFFVYARRTAGLCSRHLL